MKMEPLVRLTSALVCTATAVALAQQPRDGQQLAPRTGTAVVTGIVMSADSPPRPVRRARVTLSSPTMPIGLAGITGDDGRFRIERVPAGRYSVEAAKEAYLATSYGSKRPGRPGQPIVLGEGDHRDVSFSLQRGGVLSGTITDADGQPLAGAAVTAHRFGFHQSTGERFPLALASVPADDRGEYRVFGLAPGDYLITARASSFAPATNLQVLSPAEVRRALAEIALLRPGVARTPGMPPPPPPPAPPGPPPRAVTFVPVFYPGTTRAADAWTVHVGQAQERRGLDFQVPLVPSAAVSGIVLGPGGPAGGAAVVLMAEGTSSEPFAPNRFVRPTSSDSQGRFMFTGIPPGQYTLTARLPSAGSGASAYPGGWASTRVAVDGDDITELALPLQPGITISGHVVFAGERPSPGAALQALRVSVPVVQAAGPPVQPPSIQIQADGRFVATGVVPGAYRPLAGLQGIRTPVGGWWLQSIRLDDRELLDAPLELRRPSSDAVVTFTDRTSELSGLVTDDTGEPVTGPYVIAFSANPAHWFPLSRRIAALQLPPTGRYVVRNLPPGDYLLVVDDDVDPGQWFDPSYLGQMAGRATRVTLGPLENALRDLVIPGR